MVLRKMIFYSQVRHEKKNKNKNKNKSMSTTTITRTTLTTSSQQQPTATKKTIKALIVVLMSKMI